MKFIVTVDTEADNQWAGTGTAALQNLDGLARFQSFMHERGIRPTYLASFETLAHPMLKELARAHKDGDAEVGGHLHPWTTPPLDEGDRIQRFPLELSDDVLEAKLATLTTALTGLLGEPPVSFRAGRWGADKRVLQAIARQGYRIDSSVTPFIRWRDVIRTTSIHTAIPDFREATARPALVPGTDLLEVPMSVIATGVVPSQFLAAHSQGHGMASRIARALARPRWCRIFPETREYDLEAVYHAAVGQRLPVLVFMIHSSELVSGMSPYAKDEQAVERIFELLDAFLSFLNREGVEPILMREALLS